MGARAEFRVIGADGSVTTVPMDNIPNVADDGTFTDEEKNRARTYISQHYALPAGARIDGDTFTLTETLNGVALPPSPPISFSGVLARPDVSASGTPTVPPPTDIRALAPGSLVGRSFPQGLDGPEQLWTRASATAPWRAVGAAAGGAAQPPTSVDGQDAGAPPAVGGEGDHHPPRPEHSDHPVVHPGGGGGGGYVAPPPRPVIRD